MNKNFKCIFDKDYEISFIFDEPDDFENIFETTNIGISITEKDCENLSVILNTEQTSELIDFLKKVNKIQKYWDKKRGN